MPESRDVVFWSIRERKGRRKPWEMRWRVGPRDCSRSFTTRGLADAERSKLMAAARKGEAFSTDTGEPVSWERADKTVFDVAVSLARRDWKGSAGTTRTNLAADLVCVVLATLDPRKTRGARPDGGLVRQALKMWAFCPGSADAAVPEDVAAALAWVAACSRPVASIGDRDTARAVLDAPAMACRIFDARPVAASTAGRRRGALYRLLDHAVDLKAVESNPLAGMRVRRAESVTREVSPARLCSPQTALALLGWLREHLPWLWAYFATLLYLGARPGELRYLKRSACHLPASGWGKITLSTSVPEVDPRFTDAGEGVEVRGLKARSAGTVRVVPARPALVRILREHLALKGTANDGRMFRGPDGESMLTAAVYLGGWNKARHAVLTPDAYDTGVMSRAYDLRHLCASLALSWGVPAGEVARRLGHSLKTLLGIYAHWVAGFEATSNTLIDDGWNAVTSQNANPGPPAGQTPETIAA